MTKKQDIEDIKAIVIVFEYLHKDFDNITATFLKIDDKTIVKRYSISGITS